MGPFWGLMRADAVLQFFQSPPLVGWNTMWNVVTCCSQRTLWSKIEVCCRQAGFIVGPVCYAALAFVVRHNRDVSPISMMGWSFVGLTLFQAAAASLCLPTVVDPSAKEEEAEDVPAARTNMQEVELNPEELPPETRRRRQIVWNIFVYCSERTFTVGAIEVSTMMLLEVEYGWQTELCGASFMAVGGSSIVATKTFWTGEDKLFMVLFYRRQAVWDRDIWDGRASPEMERLLPTKLRTLSGYHWLPTGQGWAKHVWRLNRLNLNMFIHISKI